ncbi:hypothetical protein QE370_001366 [Aeromicrobium sp. SORGH_AS981]|uniref:hypothetical protein n=1 Tax=Aeromicrobium sp. SORGH_AS_0981 TaxID=3041802 RepID=UPI002860FC22|nr:hypothetical protein [Aeromicrobium sp. SORGH_AS_0981]MDR6118182.1 hypothetical protein [Aeromicrobium sp. SORGH_AS_0981]
MTRGLVSCLLLAGFLLPVGTAMALSDPDPGVRLLGATLLLCGLLFLLPLPLLRPAPRPPAVTRDGGTTTVHGSPLIQRLALAAAVLVTLAATTMTGALSSPAVLDGGTSRRPTPLFFLVLWAGAVWAWFVVVRGRNRQDLRIAGGEVTLTRGREQLTCQVTRAQVAVGQGTPSARNTVQVGSDVAPGFTVGARHFGTSAPQLAEAIRAALRR